MQAYMKSPMPYLGVATAARRRQVRSLCRAHGPLDRADFESLVLDLWRRARFREERYAAIDVLLDQRHAQFIDLELLPCLEELIVHGAWWDYVDAIASHAVGALLERYPAKMRRKLSTWARGKDIWKRRTAILSQLRFKSRTDDGFLLACIEPSLDWDEFFLQKAIGWALRQRAWSDPRATRRMVRKLSARLSPLARREALKNL
jgi:3-methyladenine DNA glycosylase AlkD